MFGDQYLLGLSEADKQGQHTVTVMHVSYRRCSNSHGQHLLVVTVPHVA